MKKILITILIIIALVFLSWYFFFYDKVITEGNAYGFTIGMQKDEAVRIILKEYGKEQNIIILSPKVRRNDTKNIKILNSNKLTVMDVQPMNVWHIQFDGKKTNVLALFFNDSKLVKLRRHRKAFTL